MSVGKYRLCDRTLITGAWNWLLVVHIWESHIEVMVIRPLLVRPWTDDHYFDMTFPDMDDDEPIPGPSNVVDLEPSYAPWSPTGATASGTGTPMPEEDISDPNVDCYGFTLGMVNLRKG